MLFSMAFPIPLLPDEFQKWYPLLISRCFNS
jgi:hypothetical protein